VRFKLDAEQTDAILELKIYGWRGSRSWSSARSSKRSGPAHGRSTRCSRTKTAGWGLVRSEIEEISSKYGDKRRTAIASDSGEPEYSAEDFIVDEDNVVIVSRDGW